jgi:diguanylate cyclase (GGDEF)-like protein
MAILPPASKAPASLRANDLLGGALAWQALLDRLDCGVAVFDAQGCLVTCNEDFKRQYPPIAERIVPGASFEQLLRLALAQGLVPQAVGQEASWLASRLRNFGHVSEPMERQMPDGRWRRISETRLPDGGVLSFSTDITELVDKRVALQSALDQARLAGERLEDALEALPAGFELWDADDKLVWSNSELARMYPKIAATLKPGVSFEQLVRANHAAGALVVPLEELDAYIERRRAERIRSQQPADHATDEGRWYRVYHRPTRHGALVGVRMDVTELRDERAAAELARHEAEVARRQLADAIEALPDGFALFDADDRLSICNAHYRELYRETAPALEPGAQFEDLLRYGLAHGQYPQAVGRESEWLAERVARHRAPSGPQIQELPGNRWLRIDERPTRDGGIAGVRTEVTELVRREQQLTELNARLAEAHAQVEALSQTDALTGIANRRRFDTRLDEEWTRVVRYGQTLGLLLVDIDHFKRYNDRHGHQQGDACLRRVAQLLAGCAGRATDVVARYGGEEFAILLPHADREETAAVARRSLAAIDDACLPMGDAPQAGQVTISIGAAWAGQGEARGKALLVRAADEALYRAKAAGRHCVVFAK